MTLTSSSNLPTRSGGTAWTEPQALDYIRRQSGKQFDPQVVEVFLKMMAEKNKPSQAEGLSISDQFTV